MTVICDVKACPYWHDDFCTNKVVKITTEGICKHLAKRNWNSPIGNEYKEFPNILTIVKRVENEDSTIVEHKEEIKEDTIAPEPKKKRGRPKKKKD